MMRLILPSKTLRYAATALAVAAIALVLAPDVLAADDFGLGKSSAGTGLPTTTNVSTIVGGILKVILQLVGTLFLLLMVYAGFLWMTARGDAKKVDQAKQLITAAVIGVIIIAGAYAITSFVLTAVTKQGGASDASEVADIPNDSVPSGGNCGMTEDCVGDLICNGGVCKTENFGDCVPGKQCTVDADCSSNGGCFDGTCSCDAI